MEDFQNAEETAFVNDEVTNIIKESVEGSIGGNAYQHNKVNQWTSNVVEQCLNQLTKLGKPFNDVRHNAEERSRSAHSELLLLGQHIRRELHGEVGEQDDVLYRVRVWSRNLRQRVVSPNTPPVLISTFALIRIYFTEIFRQFTHSC